ncbi:sugar transferase [Pediococcus acidilactici]|uniref:sugar transferase n=1 Tax=Pediococcus acidilactici TaxID=1254 RepID=UPI003A90D121
MASYVLKVMNGQKNTAGTKAKLDITTLLSKNGFNEIDLAIQESKIWKLFFLKIKVRKALNKLKENDIFVIQYPMYSRVAIKTLLNICLKKGIKTILIIHDLESLRLYRDNSKKIAEELSIFKKVGCVISHNEMMSKWLKANGVESKIENLQIFDYLNTEERVDVSKNKNLVFAGNLAKSRFLEKWDIEKKITVYGISPSKKYPKNVKYEGVKTPDELPTYLAGSFGLVWDGNSLETNSGVYGEYTKYNNPHKVSLYLSSGVPVIVWKEAAIAKFVKEKNVGIIVSNLNEIPAILEKMTDSQYDRIVANVNEIGEQLRCGKYTLDSVNKAKLFLLG